jgi:type II secretory pathway component GspD/PulD (secretin)
MYKIFTAQKCGKMPCRIPKFLLIMKLTIIIMMLTLLQVSAATLAQQVNVNIKNAPVKEVLKQLTKQTGYNFICDADIIIAAC